MQEKQYYQSLPRKRVGVGALFFNSQGEILIVKPSYKDHWSIPGGVVDENESPLTACRREIREEIGIEPPRLRFLCVDYYPNKDGKSEALQFLFHGGILNREQIEAIRLPSNELETFRFATVNEALQSVSDRMRRRLAATLKGLQRDTALYLEEGKEPSSTARA